MSSTSTSTSTEKGSWIVGEVELVAKDECGDENYFVSAVLLGATLSCYAVLLIFFGYLLWKFMSGSVGYLVAFCTYCCSCHCTSITENEGECHRNCPNHPDRVQCRSRNDICYTDTAYPPHLQHRNNNHETREKMPTSPASALLTDHPHPHPRNANDSLDEFQSIHIHTNSQQLGNNEHHQTPSTPPIQDKRKVQFSI